MLCYKKHASLASWRGGAGIIAKRTSRGKNCGVNCSLGWHSVCAEDASKREPVVDEETDFATWSTPDVFSSMEKARPSRRLTVLCAVGLL